MTAPITPPPGSPQQAPGFVPVAPRPTPSAPPAASPSPPAPGGQGTPGLPTIHTTGIDGRVAWLVLGGALLLVGGSLGLALLPTPVAAWVMGGVLLLCAVWLVQRVWTGRWPSRSRRSSRPGGGIGPGPGGGLSGGSPRGGRRPGSPGRSPFGLGRGRDGRFLGGARKRTSGALSSARDASRKAASRGRNLLPAALGGSRPKRPGSPTASSKKSPGGDGTGGGRFVSLARKAASRLPWNRAKPTPGAGGGTSRPGGKAPRSGANPGAQGSRGKSPNGRSPKPSRGATPGPGGSRPQGGSKGGPKGGKTPGGKPPKPSGRLAKIAAGTVKIIGGALGKPPPPPPAGGPGKSKKPKKRKDRDPDDPDVVEDDPDEVSEDDTRDKDLDELWERRGDRLEDAARWWTRKTIDALVDPLRPAPPDQTEYTVGIDTPVRTPYTTVAGERVPTGPIARAIADADIHTPAADLEWPDPDWEADHGWPDDPPSPASSHVSPHPSDQRFPSTAPVTSRSTAMAVDLNDFAHHFPTSETECTAAELRTALLSAAEDATTKANAKQAEADKVWADAESARTLINARAALRVKAAKLEEDAAGYRKLASYFTGRADEQLAAAS